MSKSKEDSKKTHEDISIPINLYNKMKEVASNAGQAPQRYLWGLIERDYTNWKKSVKDSS
jgi:hypothetical protein